MCPALLELPGFKSSWRKCLMSPESCQKPRCSLGPRAGPLTRDFLCLEHRPHCTPSSPHCTPALITAPPALLTAPQPSLAVTHSSDPSFYITSSRRPSLIPPVPPPWYLFSGFQAWHLSLCTVDQFPCLGVHLPLLPHPIGLFVPGKQRP